MGLVVLLSGSREHKDLATILAVLPRWPGLFIHGDQVGLDRLAADYLRPYAFEVKVPFPEHLGKAGGPRRNRVMVDLAVMYRTAGHRVEVYAFPMPGSRSKSVGTYGLIRMAKAAGFEPIVTEG